MLKNTTKTLLKTQLQVAKKYCFIHFLPKSLHYILYIVKCTVYCIVCTRTDMLWYSCFTQILIERPVSLNFYSQCKGSRQSHLGETCCSTQIPHAGCSETESPNTQAYTTVLYSIYIQGRVDWFMPFLS